MRIKALSIYPKFKCIADKCQHSCCLGWEIDIDPITRELYKNLNHKYAPILNSNIEELPEPHFRLKANDRCPFLREDNLCDMIINIGEEYLCDICRDHPRYRNYDEIGLGLCCEEVSRLVISETDPITIITLDQDDDVNTDYEFQYHDYLENILHVLNSSESIREKIYSIEAIREELILLPTYAEVYKVLKGLERLDNEWDKYIEMLNSYEPDSVLETIELNASETKSFSNIMIYFMHRYIPQSYDTDSFIMFVRFAVISTLIIMNLYANKKQTSNLIEICRLYSSEIEYSIENLEEMLAI